MGIYSYAYQQLETKHGGGVGGGEEAGVSQSLLNKGACLGKVGRVVSNHILISKVLFNRV